MRHNNAVIFNLICEILAEVALASEILAAKSESVRSCKSRHDRI